MTSSTRASNASPAVVALAGAVVATLTPPLGVLAVGVVGSVWPGQVAGGRSLSAALVETAGFAAIVGSFAMTGVYLVGVPVALLVEQRIHRPRIRLLAYAIVGFAVGAVVGALMVRNVPGAALVGGFGLVAAVAGGLAAGVCRRSERLPLRAVGRVGTGLLTLAALGAWAATGWVLIPMATAFVAGVVVLGVVLAVDLRRRRRSMS